ncbi:uncharacterized protein METZ01_LOCUS307790, partial [marine metagenome]
MKKRISVREGNSGILHISHEDATEERYIPSYDLDEARHLLLRFQELRDGEGSYLKDNYWCEGTNWLPTVVNYLHGRVFGNYVRYRPLLKQIINGE